MVIALPNEEKERIRENMKNRRQAMPPDEAEKKSAGIAFQLSKMSRYRDARSVLFYASKGNEARTKDLIAKALRSGKKVFLPITNMARQELEIAEIRNFDKDLKLGPFGIPEPANRTESEHEKIDLAIIPGLAFARNGARVGYGLGFYDKLLSKLKENNSNIKKIGLAYNFQVFDEIKAEAHDQKIDVIVTETSLIVC